MEMDAQALAFPKLHNIIVNLLKFLNFSLAPTSLLSALLPKPLIPLTSAAEMATMMITKSAMKVLTVIPTVPALAQLLLKARLIDNGLRKYNSVVTLTEYKCTTLELMISAEMVSLKTVNNAMISIKIIMMVAVQLVKSKLTKIGNATIMLLVTPLAMFAVMESRALTPKKVVMTETLTT